MTDEKQEILLTSMQSGQVGRILRIENQDEDTERLMAMGACGGREVTVIRSGNPLVIDVHGTRIGVSAELGHRIIVCALCQAGEVSTSS